MPIQLSWYLENHVILHVNQGDISDQEILDVDQPISGFLERSHAPLVHLILDNRSATTTPSIKAISQLKYPKHPRFCWLIVVGPTNTFVRFVNAVTTNLFKSRNRMFDTMDEALDFLNEVDSTLPALRDSKKKAS